jgi:WD40 repeat protein/serine/threonine protein kinase
MESIGRYIIERELGQGGTAIVYLGQDPHVKRQVVIKLLLSQYTSDPEFLARFQREAEVVAGLEHPYIVPVYDAGQHDLQPYIVMRYLSGGSLRDRIERGPYLSLPEIVSLVSRVAEALHEAHTHQIVHRDLKPANILFDTRGQAFLSDFGIAKMAEPSQVITKTGIVVGTPEYMSPEQALGTVEIDERSDVYSLGVILFQLLARQMPFKADTAMGVALAHITAPIPSIAAMNSDLVPAWDSVIQRVLAKKPEQRYQTAVELAQAVRQLAALQSKAVAQGLVAPFTAASLTSSASSAGLQSAAPVMPPRPGTTPLLSALVPRPDTKPLPTLPLVHPGTKPLPVTPRPGTRPFPNPLLQAVSGNVGPKPPPPIDTRNRLAPLVKTASIPRTWLKAEAARVSLVTRSASDVMPLARWGKGRVHGVAVTPDGSIMAVATALGIYLYSTEKLKELRFIDFGASALCVVFSPDGRRVACGSGDHLVRVWEVESGQLVQMFKGHEDDVISLAFSPVGDLLASGGSDAIIRIWDTVTGQAQEALRGHRLAVSSLTFSPDGQRLASGSPDCTILVWEVNSGEMLNNLHLLSISPVTAVFTPQGHPLAVGSFDNAIRLWDGENGEMLQVFEPLPGDLTCVGISRDMRWLISGGDDGRVRRWAVGTGQLAQTLEGHVGEVHSLIFNPLDESDALVSGGTDGTVRLWNTGLGQRTRALEGYLSEMNCLACLAGESGHMLAMGSQDNTIRLLDLISGRMTRTLVGHTAPPTSLIFGNLEGKRQVLVSGGQDKTVRLWDAGLGQPMGALKRISHIVSSLAISVDGRILAVGDHTRVIRLWDLYSGQLRLELKGHTQGITSVAYSPDGKLLASGSEDNTARVWDARTGKPRFVLEGHPITITSVAFSSDSQLLATGSEDSTVRVWDLRTGQLVHKLEGHISYVRCVAFNPAAGSRLLASCGSDRTVRLWDAQAGKVLRTLEGHTGAVNSVVFTADSQLLVSGGNDGVVMVWGAPGQ